MADLLIEGTTTAHPTEARGIRATVVVTVPALALLEETDAAVAAAGADPATVEGVGADPDRPGARTVRRRRDVDAGAHASRDGRGALGRTQPVLASGVAEAPGEVASRPVHGSGCGMPASRCEIDHTIAWEHGGDTALENLAPLCKGHHKVKHHGGWQLKQIPDSGGAVEWTSPAGRRYVVPPVRRVPVFTVSSDAPSTRPPF